MSLSRRLAAVCKPVKETPRQNPRDVRQDHGRTGSRVLERGASDAEQCFHPRRAASQFIADAPGGWTAGPIAMMNKSCSQRPGRWRADRRYGRLGWLPSRSAPFSTLSRCCHSGQHMQRRFWLPRRRRNPYDLGSYDRPLPTSPTLGYCDRAVAVAAPGPLRRQYRRRWRLLN